MFAQLMAAYDNKQTQHAIVDIAV